MRLEQIIDDYIKTEREEEGHIKSGLYVASSLGQCYRRQYFNRKDEPPTNPFDKRTLRVFQVGTMFHEYITEIYEAWWRTQEGKDPLYLNYKVQKDDVIGYPDIVTDEEVVELKTQHSRKFWYMHKKPELDIIIEQPEHVLQAVFYAACLDKPNIKLVYISKDDLSIEEYPVVVSDFLKMKLDLEISTLNDYWVKKALPPAEPRLYKDKGGKSKECSYCLWKDKCSEIEQGGKLCAV